MQKPFGRIVTWQQKYAGNGMCSFLLELSIMEKGHCPTPLWPRHWTWQSTTVQHFRLSMAVRSWVRQCLFSVPNVSCRNECGSTPSDGAIVIVAEGSTVGSCRFIRPDRFWATHSKTSVVTEWRRLPRDAGSAHCTDSWRALHPLATLSDTDCCRKKHDCLICIKWIFTLEIKWVNVTNVLSAVYSLCLIS